MVLSNGGRLPANPRTGAIESAAAPSPWLLVVLLSVGFLNCGEGISVGLLLSALSCNLCLRHGRRPQALQLHLRPPLLDDLSRFGILLLGRPLRSDLFEIDLTTDLDFGGLQDLFRVRLLDLAIRLSHGGIGVDDGDPFLGLAFFLRFSDPIDHTGVSNIDLRLALSAFVSFAGERLRVSRITHILQLLDVGVLDAETELFQFLRPGL